MSATTSATQSELFVNEPITDSPVRVRPASRGFVRYVLAICIGVAATLAWQSYGQTAKLTSSDAAARPSLPETAQAATVAQTAPDKVAPRMPIAGSVDPQQIQQIARDIAGLRQSVEQVVASQTKMAGEINNLLVTDMEIFLKIPTPPQPPAALSRKPIPAAPPLRAPNRRTDVTPNQSLADSFRN